MLRWRLLMGTMFAVTLAALCVFDFYAAPGSWLFPLALVVTVALAKEMLDLLTTDTQRPLPWAVYLGTVLVVSSNVPYIYVRSYLLQPNTLLVFLFHPIVLTLITFVICVIIVLVAEIFRFRERRDAVVNAALAIFAIAYIGLLMSALIQLRVIHLGRSSMIALVSLIAVVKFADIGAYTVGRLFGRHQLAPALSPGKTVEGAIGALVFAVLAAWGSLVYLPILVTGRPSQVGWLTIVVYGLVIGIFGMLGDLAESLIKRDSGKKDSSNVLPGFGGVFDVLDSILFAAPAALLFWRVFLFR